MSLSISHVHLPTAPSFRLAGRRALVTGASGGIGLAAAAALSEAGARVTMLARSAERLEACASAIIQRGGDADMLALDLTDLPGVATALSRREPFDILVNNAATNIIGPIENVADTDFDRLVDINVRAAYFTTQAVVAGMRRAGRGGSIINMSSQLGHVGASERSLYALSKFAIEGMTKALAVELGPDRIRVNAIAPTFIDTPLTRSYGLDENALDKVRSKIKLGRIGAVDDIVGAVIYLASDASSLVTGTSLLVDGGWTAD